MAYAPQSQGPWLKGLVASNQPLAQPKGSFPRGSNLVMMERGALTPCDGSGIINWFNAAIQNNVGRFMSLFLYEPTGVNPYYLAIKQALDEQLGAPHINTATVTSGGSLVSGQEYFYVITALDGVGGETVKSNEVHGTPSGGNLSVTLVWNVVPNAFAYNVYRGLTTGTEVLLIGSKVPVIQPSPLTPTVTFIDDGSAITSETLTGVNAVGYTNGGQAFILFTLPPPEVFPSNNLTGVPITSSGFTPSTFNGNWIIFSQPNLTSIIVKGGPGSGSSTAGTPATAGPNSPATAVDRNDLGGLSVWFNPTNVFVLDGVVATNNVPGGSLADALQATNYGFAIPAGSTITGISATSYAAATGTMVDFQVFLVKAGVIVGSNRASGVHWAAAITARNYGSSTDLWGTGWIPADINNAGFGFLVAPSAAGANQAKIDYMPITVSYITPGGAGSLTITATTVPPVSDTTQQTVLIQMPTGVVPISYSDANIVAFYPASLGALGQVPTGGSGGQGTTGPGINGQGSSTPSGGVIGLVGPIPQFKQFTNRAIIALGNGFAIQVFWDSTGTTVNKAPTGAVSSVSVSADVVTVTSAIPLSATDPTSPGFIPVGSNVILSNMSDPTYNGTFVVISVSTPTFKIRNPHASGGPSTGTWTVATTPISDADNTFVPQFPKWAATVAVVAGDIYEPTTQPGASNIYITCIQSGVTGSVEPTWPTVALTGQQFPHGNTRDGSALWQETGYLTAAVPPGAGHIEIYSGSLWAFNTFPIDSQNGLEGPTSIRMSNVNNIFGWNPVNQAFLDKDDGAEGMGLGKFTITALGIPPEGSLIAFKYRVPYQIIGVFGANNFAIQPVSSDMGCLAPRTIQFVSGYGLARYTHLGYSVFDGYRDQVVSEQIRPYLFPVNDFDVRDITVADANYIPLSWAAQTANPPMYAIAIPIGNSGGQLTRIMLYDLILKCWAAPVDLPFPIGCMAQVQPVTSNPLTIIGGFNDGALQRWQAGDVLWYTGGGVSQIEVAWSLRTMTVASQNSSQRIWARKIMIRGTGSNVDTDPAMVLNVQIRSSAVVQSSINYTASNQGDFDIDASIGLTGLRFDATISGTDHLELDGLDWAIEPRPFGVPVGIV